jgi:monoamine oxidase
MTLLSRRQALAGAALVAMPFVARANSHVLDFDAVIVGAGAAGLAAAHELRRRQKTFVVLEARNRAGGRIFTDHSLGAPYDAGAFYIHWADKNPLTRIARDVGVRTVDEENALRGASRMIDRGDPPASAQALAQWARLRDRLDEGRSRIPEQSMLAYAGGLASPAAEGALAMSRLAFGEEAERISTLDYARLIAGDDRLVPDGFGTVLERFAKKFDIRFNTPVRAVDWSGPGVRIDTGAGAIVARSVIFTVSVGVLKAGSIAFRPALPVRNMRGLDGLGMGASTRMALRFDGARFGLTPHTNVRLRLSPRQSFSFGCFAWDRDIVTAYFGGDHAREIIALGEMDACAHVLDRFADAIGSDVRKHYRDGRLNGWWSDPYARGAYSHALPGYPRARADLAAPVGERIFFAGEATGGADGAGGAAMTAGGAWLSGLAAAQKAARRG